MKNRLKLTMIMGMSLLGVAACDTDYGSIDKTPFPNNEPISGIWNGTWTYTPPEGSGGTSETIDTTLVATEANEFWMIERGETSNCVHLSYGAAHSQQANVNGSFGWHTTCGFTDGTDYGSGTLTGTADLHVTITLSITETDSKNYQYATFSPTFKFDDRYLEGSDLATVAGNYTDGSGTAVSVSGSGTITGATVGTCAAAGSISLINADFNLYRVSYTLSGCASADAALNGAQMSGLGFYDSTSNPHAFNFVGHGADSNGANVVFADAFIAS